MSSIVKEKGLEKEFLEFVKDLISAKDKQKARIAILISLFRKYEGASEVAKYQAKELSKNGHDVSIFTFETNVNVKDSRVEVNLIRPFIPKLYTWIYRALFFLDIVTTIRLISKLKHFDLIIIHHGNMAILGIILKKLFKTKVVFWNHHIDDKEVILPLRYRIYNAVFGTINWKIIRKFDYVVSISHFSRRQLKALTGIDSIVIYNKVDDKFREGLDGNIIRRRYGLRDEPLLLFVGRIIPSKNIHLLIEILKLIKREILNAKLIIVGRRDDKEYYEKLVRIADSSVFFEENVPDEELPLYYAACDVYVTCSRLEGFNLPLVEAQACGKPVVAFDIGPHREVIKRGYIIRPYDIESFKEKVVELLTKSRLLCSECCQKSHENDKE